MDQIILNGIKAMDLLDRMEERFNKALLLFANLNPKQNDEPSLISRKDVSTLLKISLPTLNDWTKKGTLTSYKIGSRVLYKLAEVQAALRERNYTKLNLV